MPRELVRTEYVIKGQNEKGVAVYAAFNDRDYGSAYTRADARRWGSWDAALEGAEFYTEYVLRARVVEVKVYRKRRPSIDELIEVTNGGVRVGDFWVDAYIPQEACAGLRKALAPYFPARKEERS
jgi:hypothetical protein